jgi:hypothetical protein
MEMIKLSVKYPDIKSFEIIYRIHATKRMFERNITEQNVYEIIENGSIIEEYQEDFPFPSVLVNGKITDNRYIHIVVGINSEERRVFIITVYEPDPSIWGTNFIRRIK